jgi:hypothetical protein
MQRLIPLVHRPSPARTIQKQSKRIATDIGLPTLISSKGVPRNAEVGRKKRCRKGCTSVPEAQKLKMKQMHIAGMNISEIAEEAGTPPRFLSLRTRAGLGRKEPSELPKGSESNAVPDNALHRG